MADRPMPANERSGELLGPFWSQIMDPDDYDADATLVDGNTQLINEGLGGVTRTVNAVSGVFGGSAGTSFQTAMGNNGQDLGEVAGQSAQVGNIIRSLAANARGALDALIGHDTAFHTQLGALRTSMAATGADPTEIATAEQGLFDQHFAAVKGTFANYKTVEAQEHGALGTVTGAKPVKGPVLPGEGDEEGTEEPAAEGEEEGTEGAQPTGHTPDDVETPGGTPEPTTSTGPSDPVGTEAPAPAGTPTITPAVTTPPGGAQPRQQSMSEMAGFQVGDFGRGLFNGLIGNTGQQQMPGQQMGYPNMMGGMGYPNNMMGGMGTMGYPNMMGNMGQQMMPGMTGSQGGPMSTAGNALGQFVSQMISGALNPEQGADMLGQLTGVDPGTLNQLASSTPDEIATALADLINGDGDTGDVDGDVEGVPAANDGTATDETPADEGEGSGDEPPADSADEGDAPDPAPSDTEPAGPASEPTPADQAPAPADSGTPGGSPIASSSQEPADPVTRLQNAAHGVVTDVANGAHQAVDAVASGVRPLMEPTTHVSGSDQMMPPPQMTTPEPVHTMLSGADGPAPAATHVPAAAPMAPAPPMAPMAPPMGAMGQPMMQQAPVAPVAPAAPATPAGPQHQPQSPAPQPSTDPAGQGHHHGGGAAPAQPPAAPQITPQAAFDAAVGVLPGIPEMEVRAHQALAAVRTQQQSVGFSTPTAVGVFVRSGRAHQIVATTDAIGFLAPGSKLPSNTTLLGEHVDGEFFRGWAGYRSPAAKLIAASQYAPGSVGVLQLIVSSSESQIFPDAEVFTQPQQMLMRLVDGGALPPIDRGRSAFGGRLDEQRMEMVQSLAADYGIGISDRDSLLGELPLAWWDEIGESQEYRHVWTRYLLAELQQCDPDEAGYLFGELQFVLSTMRA